MLDEVTQDEFEQVGGLGVAANARPVGGSDASRLERR